MGVDIGSQDLLDINLPLTLRSKTVITHNTTIKGHHVEDHLERPTDDLPQAEEADEAAEAEGEADPEEKVKRDVRSVKKFIEVALVLDKAMFDKRPHSSRKDVIHDAIQVANIADLVSFSKNFKKCAFFILMI